MEAFMICGQDESQNYPQGTERADELKKHHFEKREKKGRIKKMDDLDNSWFPFKIYIYIYIYEVPVNLMNVQSHYLSVQLYPRTQ